MTEHEKLYFEIISNNDERKTFTVPILDNIHCDKISSGGALIFKLQEACKAIDEMREEIEKLKIRNKSLVDAIYSLSSGINFLYNIENNKKNNGECWLQQPSIPTELLK